MKAILIKAGELLALIVLGALALYVLAEIALPLTVAERVISC